MLLTLRVYADGIGTALCLWESWRIKHLLEDLEMTYPKAAVFKNLE